MYIHCINLYTAYMEISFSSKVKSNTGRTTCLGHCTCQFAFLQGFSFPSLHLHLLEGNSDYHFILYLPNKLVDQSVVVEDVNAPS